MDDEIDDVYDEDKDFDESQSSGGDSEDAGSDSDGGQRSRVAMAIRREQKMLDNMSKYLIPYIGGGVENVVLGGSKGLTNAMVGFLSGGLTGVKVWW